MNTLNNLYISKMLIAYTKKGNGIPAITFSAIIYFINNYIVGPVILLL